MLEELTRTSMLESSMLESSTIVLESSMLESNICTFKHSSKTILANYKIILAKCNSSMLDSRKIQF